MECPSEADWLDWLEGHSTDASAAGDEHLSTCAECRLLLVALSRSEAVEPFADEATGQADVGASTSLPLPAGTRVGRYVIRYVVGAGASGIVYAAHDPQLDRDVALKILRGRR